MYTRGGCFLNADPRDFDPSFFGINPLECKSIDPAQRKLLEVVYEAFESSGTRIEDLSGSNTGCFVGNFNTDHQLMQYRDAEYPQPYGITGGGIALLSNRINYIFNLHGPSLTLDTACSSSMYALHLACTAIQNNDCKAALVGGSNLILSPECQLFSSSLGAVSKTSMCHTFDAKADGYARADGIGALYIKSLAQAIADRDPIRAVIRGTAVNANGKTGGITHPDPDGQEAAISQAYARAGLDPSETPYMELHGTGTPVGDPLEVEAVGRVFAPGRTEDTPPLLIGSVKSNMGHAEPASGIAGVMKAVLVLEEGIVPPIRALERVNPALDLRGGRIQIVTRHTRLPEGVPRRASVNSFGYGGANAHAVLELASSWGKYKALAKKAGHTDFVNGNVDSRRRKYLLAFSAHNEKTLRANIAALARPAAKWATKDVAYTLNCRRSRFASRTFAVVEDGNASAQLESCSPTVVRLSGASKSKRLGFVFTGQGAQWPQMGLELLARFPVYLQSIRRMDSVLQHLSPPAAWSIEATLREPASTSKVYEAEISQPLVTAVQIALVDLLSSWKVRPVACVGHSSGEIAAAYASGRLSLAEAITTAYCRGQAVLANTQNGKMLAVGAGEAAVRAYLPRYPGVVCACVNSPESVTLSGDAEQIERLRSELEQQAVFARVLATGGNAYHSAHMTALGPLYEERMHEALAQIPATGPCVHRWPVAADFVSSVTGGFRSENMPVDAKYWRDNLESPVLFYAAVAQLVGQAAPDVLVEIGPHAALQGPLRQIGQALRDGKFQEYVPTMVRKQDGDTSLMQTAGTLFCTGYDIDLYRVNADEYLDPASGSVERVSEDKVVADLPTYQWQYGEQLYHENRWTREWRLRTHARHDVLGSRVPGGNLNEPVWRNVVAVKDLPWVADHTVGSDIVFPTTGFLCMAVEAATQIAELRGIDAGDVTAYDLENVILKSALVVPMDDDGVEVLVAFRPEKLDGLHFGFTVTSVTNSGGKDIFTEHVTGTVGFLTEGVAAYPAQAPETSGWNKKPSTSRWYDTFAQAGLKYGPAFQSLTDIKTPEDGEAAQCTVALTPSQKHVAEGSRYAVHPVTMDAALQLGIIAAHRGRTSKCRHSFLPTRIDSLRIWPQFVKGRTVSTTADATFLNARSSNVQLTMIGEGGAPILSALNVYFTRTESAALEPADEHAAPYARLAWKPDVEMLTRQKVLVLFESTGKRDADTMPPLELLAFHQTVQFFTRHSDLFEKGSKEPQLQRFLDWIAQKVQDSQDGKTAQGREILALSDAQRQSQIDMLEQTLMSFGEAPETQLMCHMYRSMPAIYRGSISGIQAAMQHDYLNQMYRDMTLYHAGNSALKDLIVLLSHKNPALNILEIGGGTGSATRVLLPALNGDKLYRGYGKYTFTDITSSFLATAADNFRQHTSVEFRTFDMETPPAEQGYQAEHDLVIASNVIHATSDIVRTLRHIRATLKPGGRLALFELVRPRMCWTMILGTFSDFWKGDADPMFPRCEGPFLTVEMWMRVLPMAGFSGVDLLLDCFDETRGSGVILSTAVEESASISAGLSGSHAVSLVYRHTVTESVQDFAEHLAAAGYAVELVPLTSQQRLQHSRAIFLAEIDEPLLTDINEGEWAGFKHLLLTSSSALWVTKGGLLQGGKAEYAMFSGIARTIHTENRSTKLITVDIDPNSSSTKAEVFELLRELELKAVSYIPGSDFEFRCNRDCIPYISRLTEDAALNKAAQQESKRHTSSEYKLWMPINNEDEPLRMVIDNLPDASSTAHFEPQPPFQRLSPEEIDIAVSSLSFSSDSISELERSDVAHSAHIMGVLGTVLRAGSQSIYTSGKKVLGIAPARSAGSRVRVKAHACVDVGESAADAASQSQHWLASVPVPFCAAVYGLLDLAQLQSGERVLVMSAASTVGLAACRVAALTGARVLAFVQTGEQKARVLACFSGLIREEDVLVAAALDESVSRQVMQCTDQRGIDVIFAYGEHVKAPRSWPVAPFGRIVGSTLVLSSGNGAVEALKKRASISSIDLEELLRDRPEVVARYVAFSCSGGDDSAEHGADSSRESNHSWLKA